MKKHCSVWKYCLLTAVLVGGLVGCGRQEAPFLMLGEQEIAAEEYVMFAYDHLSGVALEYAQTYGADPNEDGFWEREYDGKTPMESLKEQTMEQLVAVKGVQICAREAGLVESVDYEVFVEEWNQENKNRQEKLDANEVFYGPEQLSFPQFYSYRYSQIYERLEQWAEDQVNPTEEALQDYYLVLQEQERGRNFTAQLRYVHWDADKNQEDGEEEMIFLDTRNLSKEDYFMEQVMRLVQDAEPGDGEIPIEYGGQTGFIYVVKKEAEEFGSYEEMREITEYAYREMKGKEFIQSEIQKLELKEGKAFQELTYESLREIQKNTAVLLYS